MFGQVQRDALTSNSATKGILTCHKLVCDTAVISNLQGVASEIIINPNIEVITVKGFLPSNYVSAGTTPQLLNNVRDASAATAISDPQVLVLPNNATLLQFFIYQDSVPIVPPTFVALNLSGFPAVSSAPFICEKTDTSQYGLGVRGWGLNPPYPFKFGSIGSHWDTTFTTTDALTGVAYALAFPITAGNFVVELQYAIVPP